MVTPQTHFLRFEQELSELKTSVVHLQQTRQQYVINHDFGNGNSNST